MSRKMSVFLIEDNEMYSVMLDHELSKIGDFRLYSYDSAEAAIKDLYIHPDVIVLDYGLPGMNGLEAINKFKQNYPDIPIIVLSGQSNIDVTIEMIRSGACEYMSKKMFSANELHTKICSIYDQKQREKEKVLFKLMLNKSLLIFFLILLVSAVVWYKF